MPLVYIQNSISFSFSFQFSPFLIKVHLRNCCLIYFKVFELNFIVLEIFITNSMEGKYGEAEPCQVLSGRCVLA